MKGKQKVRVLMLVQSNFPQDIRVRQEAIKLKNNGYEVSVISLKNKDQISFETVEGIKVYRVPNIELFKRGKHARSEGRSLFSKIKTLIMAITGYGFEFLYFTFACFVLSFLILLRDRFDVIHTHNPPDTLFMVAGFWKLFGKKFVYDHHDLSPDLFIEKYGKRVKIIYNILLILEKISCKTADFIIATNESYKKVEIERHRIKPEKIYIVRNGPNLKEMKITEPIHDIRKMHKSILCYLGAINVQDGVDYLLVVLGKIIHNYNFHEIYLLIIGDGDYLPKIKDLAEELEITKHILFTGLISDRSELCKYLSTVDIFVDAAPYSFLNDRSTFIKHMEYMIFKKPIVSFKLKENMFSLKDAGLFITPNNTDRMAKEIIALIKNKETKERLGENAGKRVVELAWEQVSKPLLELYKVINQND